MPLYKYTAVDDHGIKKTGTVVADSEQDLAVKLAREGYYPVLANKKYIIYFKCPNCNVIQVTGVPEYPGDAFRHLDWLERMKQNGIYHTCSSCGVNIPLYILKLAQDVGWCYECNLSEKIIKKEQGWFKWIISAFLERSSLPRCSNCGEILRSWVPLNGQELIDKMTHSFKLGIQKLDPAQRFVASIHGFWFLLSCNVRSSLFDQDQPFADSSFVIRIVVTNEWHLQHYQMRLQAAQMMYSIWKECVLREMPGFKELVRKLYHTNLDTNLDPVHRGHFEIAFSIQDIMGNEVGGLNLLGTKFLFKSEVWVQKESGLLSQGL